MLLLSLSYAIVDEGLFSGRVVDVSDQVKLNPNYEVTVDDIVCNENEFGCYGPGTVVIFYTGWASRWPNQERVFGLEGLLGLDLLPIDYNYPGLSEGEYLTSSKIILKYCSL